MGNEVLGLKTDEDLLKALREALSHKPTAEEIEEQRVSFVYGSLSSKSSVTRDQVRHFVADRDGLKAA